jgi:hypothetical protein
MKLTGIFGESHAIIIDKIIDPIYITFPITELFRQSGFTLSFEMMVIQN